MICDIAIPVWNKKELTQRCVNSILSNTDHPYRIVLIDNGSRQPAAEYLKSVSESHPDKIRLIVNKENLGNTTAGVQAMKYSDADYVCILDNDTIVCKGWLSEMIRVAELSEKFGIINPNCNSFGVHRPAGMPLEDFGRELLHKNGGKFIEVGAAVGFCYLVKRKLINEIGCWDERFSPGYFEDTEYSMRAKKYGYKSVIALGAYIFHDEHSSFKSKDKKKLFEKLFNESQKKFHAMYGKPQRVLYILTKPVPDCKTLNNGIYRHADKGDFVSVFIKDGACEPDRIIIHGNVKTCCLHGAWFGLRAISRIIVKKKKFNKIYTDNKILAVMLAAEVMHG